MVDRSSRPHRSPNRTPTRTERRIIKVRVMRRWGPARIAYLLGLNVSTVHRVLTRYGLASCAGSIARPAGDPSDGSAALGDLVHVDVKKLGKIPAGGGWRMLGRTVGNRNAQADKSSGQLTPAPQPRTRLSLPAHRGRRALPAGLQRAAGRRTERDRGSVLATRQRLVQRMRDRVRKVLTDNGSCYRSHAFRDALGDIEHRRTRPTGRRQTARSKGSTAPWPTNGPTPGSTAATPNAVPSSPLAAHLQSPPRPHRTRRPTTRQPRT